jgi:4a-hydroxytetrahydrobiopterin dehydratase
MQHQIDQNQKSIKLTVKTKSYADAVAVSIKAFLLAEKMNHHPIVTTDYNSVTIEISTHDAGNKVTSLDEQYIEVLVNSLK